MASDDASILVVGSINMDLVVRSEHIPVPGETILGDGFHCSPGGKGANQAVAVSRLGCKCRMIGAVGNDAFGAELLETLQAEGIDCDAVSVLEDVPSGAAMIVVDSKGENSIVVASGANFRVTADDHLLVNEHLFEASDVVLLQLELPLTTVRAAIELARRHRCKVILDPAPAPRRLPEELCLVDIISPNITEAEAITGNKAGSEERLDKQIASDLIELGAKAAALKLGPKGSLIVTAEGDFYTIPAYKVNVVDTTAAGDAYTAALAVAVARGEKLHQAAKFASAAGSLACTKIGAQVAMPTAEQVQFLMMDQEL